MRKLWVIEFRIEIWQMLSRILRSDRTASKNLKLANQKNINQKPF